MALAAYLTALQRLLGTGSTGNLYSTAELTAYLNTARNQIAGEGQCVRRLSASAGALGAITVGSRGSGYTTVQVIVSAPDSPSGVAPGANGVQATATAALSGGTITAVTVLSAGGGYFAPAVTFSGNGTGATAVATTSGVSQTYVGQEVYPFAAVTPGLAFSGSGILEILQVNSVSLIWGTFRYTPTHLGFSKYQAQVRNYSAGGYLGQPGISAQFGQGDAGSLYLYPVPDQSYAMEWDCFCLPVPLLDDSTVEAIPYPWTEAVPFRAAYYALSGKQRFADADRMWKESERFLKNARQQAQSRGIPSWYGRV